MGSGTVPFALKVHSTAECSPSRSCMDCRPSMWSAGAGKGGGVDPVKAFLPEGLRLALLPVGVLVAVATVKFPFHFHMIRQS